MRKDEINGQCHYFTMKQLIVALDLQDKHKALELVKKLSPYVDIFKVDPILFLQDGPQIIKEIKKIGKEVFLDLKFHDIPQTVKRSVESAQKPTWCSSEEKDEIASASPRNDLKSSYDTVS